ncbi:cysteine proteinase [Microthyrium microscopicum]|uniref:Cysteine proteinase n=1 Tax=Microthyrium microscopicum TaxID=703497 RepID=A0A6A6U431_9PEZI|nr:cysteine proteinase [Microthyrium microscopicum]
MRSSIAAIQVLAAVTAVVEAQAAGGSGKYKATYTTVPGFAKHTIYAPATPPAEKLPMITWGNSGCAGDGVGFATFLTELASHGYVVVVSGSGSNFNSQSTNKDMQDSITWASSPGAAKYNIDTSKIATSGQSCGGIQALHVGQGNPKVKLITLFNSGSLGAQDSVVAAKVNVPIGFFLGGSSDIAFANGEKDYNNNIPKTIPALKASYNSGHMGTYFAANGGTYGKAAVNWFNWQLKNDTTGKAAFQPGGLLTQEKMSLRPTYTDEEITQYLEHIYGASHKLSTAAALREGFTNDPVETLTSLQLHHQGTIPWGDVALHYSKTKTVSLEPDALFQKLVIRKLGGYCMEVNTFLATVLHSVGVKLYRTGGRISNAVEPHGRDPEGFSGFEHMVILATLNGKIYHVDVGFANHGPIGPIPLEDGAMVAGVPGIQVRLVRKIIKGSVSGQKLWVLETKDATSNAWKNAYCFGEQEFLPQDFVSMNYRTMTDPTSWFTYTLIMARVFLKEGANGEKEAEGTLTLVGDTVTQRIGAGESKVVVKCESEQDRVDALKKYFGIVLNQEGVKGIVGAKSEIKSR